MKNRVLYVLTAAALACALAAGTGVFLMRQAQDRRQAALDESLSRASAVHEEISGRYRAALDALEESRLTVTENGAVVGVYTLADLGLAEGAKEKIDGAFEGYDRLDAEDFAALPQEERLAELSRADFEPEPVSLTAGDPDFSRVMRDLNAAPRSAAKDCAPYFAETGFAFTPEVPGTQLDEARVLSALDDALDGLELAEEPLALSFELTDCDPYLAPKITLENQAYDLNALLKTILHNRNYKLHVDLRGTDAALDADACASLLEVDGDGSLRMKRDEAAAYVEQWAQDYDADNVPYYFSSYSAGKVSLPFLTVNCRLDREGMLDALEQALCRLSNDTVDAPYECSDWRGRPVDISGTYIEVDIARQTMSFFCDGELFVTTPVVSGRPSGHMTPSGLYHILTKNGERWLNGPDYSVYVHYWLGFYDAYGIHDAMWRSVFGDQLYLTNGSHGCVNTPTEAMAQIFSRAEVGTPVLVFNVP